jgi:hypothetical protein
MRLRLHLRFYALTDQGVGLPLGLRLLVGLGITLCLLLIAWRGLCFYSQWLTEIVTRLFVYLGPIRKTKLVDTLLQSFFWGMLIILSFSSLRFSSSFPTLYRFPILCSGVFVLRLLFSHLGFDHFQWLIRPNYFDTVLDARCVGILEGTRVIEMLFATLDE